MSAYVISGRTPESTGRQHGLVVVELAITLPLIVLIMFATAELGRAFYQYATLTKAVEAGTRYYASAVNDLTLTTDPVATTINLIATASPDGSGGAVLPNGGISVTGGDISFDGVHVFVTAEYDFVPMLGAKLPIVGSLASYTMTVSHTMRAL